MTAADIDALERTSILFAAVPRLRKERESALAALRETLQDLLDSPHRAELSVVVWRVRQAIAKMEAP